MQVVIVAITRARSGLCIGAVDARNGTPYRLLGPTGEFVSQLDFSPYSVGDVWEVDGTHPPTTPPHVEDLHVKQRSRLGATHDLVGFIGDHCPIWTADLSTLFNGALRVTGNGSSYIDSGQVPPFSTAFWQANTQLNLDSNSSRYRVDSRRTLAYVGTQPALAIIKAGSLVRLSLARWWRPETASDDCPYRCYLQLSGWY